MKKIEIILCFTALAVLAVLGSCTKETGPSAEEISSADSAVISSTDTLFVSTNGGGSVSFDNLGGTVIVRVDCDADWTAVVDGDWLEESISINALLLTAIENIEDRTYSATVTLMTAKSGIEFATISVTQDESGPHDEAFFTRHIVVSSSDSEFTSTDEGGVISFASEGGTVEISVDCSVPDCEYEWTAKVNGSADWLETSVSDNVLTLVSAPNESYWPVDPVTVTLATVDSGIEFAVLTVNLAELYMPEEDKALILEYTIDAGTTVYLPITETVNCTVDWGDGSVEAITSNRPHHVYSSGGVFDVTITGTVTGLNSNSANIAQSGSHDKKLTAVKQWGMTGLTTMNMAVRYCDNLASIPPDKYGSFANVTTFSFAFGYDPALTEIPEGLLDYATKATVFESIFRECSAVEKIPDGLFDNCVSATTYQYAFNTCTALTSVPDHLFSNSPNVTDFQYAFGADTNLTTIPVNLFDGCNLVTDFSKVFKNCTNLTGESPYTTVNGTKVHLYERTEDLGFTVPTTTTECFYGAKSLTDYDDIPSSWK